MHSESISLRLHSLAALSLCPQTTWFWKSSLTLNATDTARVYKRYELGGHFDNWTAESENAMAHTSPQEERI